MIPEHSEELLEQVIRIYRTFFQNSLIEQSYIFSIELCNESRKVTVYKLLNLINCMCVEVSFSQMWSLYRLHIYITYFIMYY